MKSTRAILFVAVANVVAATAAFAGSDGSVNETGDPTPELSVEREQLNKIADWYLDMRNKADPDAEANFVWSLAIFDSERFYKILEDYYLSKRFRRTKDKTFETYINMYLPKFVEMKQPKSKAKKLDGPEWVLVASEEVIDKQILKLWTSKNKDNLQKAIWLASSYYRLSDNIFARRLDTENGSIPVIMKDDAKLHCGKVKAFDEWSVCYFETTENGNWVVTPVGNPAWFFFEREVQLTRELCRHLGCSRFQFSGKVKSQTESKANAHGVAVLDAGKVEITAEAEYSQSGSNFVERALGIAATYNEGNGAETIDAGRSRYSFGLRQRLESEESTPGGGTLLSLERDRKDSGKQLTGEHMIVFSYQQSDYANCAARIHAGFKILGIPVGAFLDAAATKKERREEYKTWAWTVDFPQSTVTDMSRDE